MLIFSTHLEQGKWLLNPGASHHMASSLDIFSSIEPFTSTHILMGNNTYMKVCKKGSIPIREGTFNDVLCVPSLTTNIISIYQITHGEHNKIVDFIIDYVYIRDMDTRNVKAMGISDHTSCLYSFAYFFNNDDDIHDVPNPLSRVNNSCEENIGHLNHFVLEISVELPNTPPPNSLEINSTIQQDDINALDIVVWDEFLDSLSDESHNSDFIITSEEVSFLDTSSPSLEIRFPNSSCSLSFSHLIGYLDGVTKSLSLETPIRDAYMETFFLLTHFLHGVASSFFDIFISS